jgi:hypothetical protein
MHERHSLISNGQSQAIYGYPFETEDDVNWVMEQIAGQIQSLGGTVKGSREAVYISLPSGVLPEQISPLHLLRFNVMIF